MHLGIYYPKFQHILLKVIVDADGGKSADGAGSTAAAYISKFRDQVPKCTAEARRDEVALDDQTRSLEDGMTAAGLENATIVECSLV